MYFAKIFRDWYDLELIVLTNDNNSLIYKLRFRLSLRHDFTLPFNCINEYNCDSNDPRSHVNVLSNLPDNCKSSWTPSQFKLSFIVKWCYIYVIWNRMFVIPIRLRYIIINVYKDSNIIVSVPYYTITYIFTV